MLNALEMTRRLNTGARTCLSGVPQPDELTEWFVGMSTAELIRADSVARQWSWDPIMGPSREWTDQVLHNSPPVAAVLASMHRDGHVRERAVTRLAAVEGKLADRALALRATDHVLPIREAAMRSLVTRVSKESADSIMGVLEASRDRVNGDGALDRYLAHLIQTYGEVKAWSLLRASDDRTLRRAAFRASIQRDVLHTAELTQLLLTEKDPVVRTLICRALEKAPQNRELVEALLTHGTAAARAQALVHVDATQVDRDLLRDLLIDSSILVRLWARKKWAELGEDAVAACAALARDPTVFPRRRARAYVGMIEAGGSITREEAADLVHCGIPALVRTGLTYFIDHGAKDDVPLLLDALRTRSAKTSQLATTALLTLHRYWTVDDLRPLKDSGVPEMRRNAWTVHRGLGGWEATIADLEIGLDPDPALAGNWQRFQIPMHSEPSSDQLDRLRALVRRYPADAPGVAKIVYAARLA